jgi:diguanylate cyclase (GGDEF)-like protein
MSVMLLAIGMVGIMLITMGMVALRAYAEHNLNLIARSMRYTVEAATVFHDGAAAREALATIAAEEDVGSATVYDPDNRTLAEWRHPPEGFPWLRAQLDMLLTPPPVYIPIVHQRQTVGYLYVTGHTANLMSFLLTGLAGVLACMVLSGWIAGLISKRTLRSISQPLRNLAQVAHDVRNERAFDRRTPPAEIAELNELGDDFNALLDELQAWQSQMQRENASLAHKAAHDSLTGLPNRAHFEEQLVRAIHDANALARRVAVMFLDIDLFKGVNDRLGHAAGDAVLVNVAARVRSLLREGDVVARLGGDEFAIILSPLRDVGDAERIADDILLGMKAPIRLPDGGHVEGSLSIGLAVYPDHAVDSSSLFHAADAAMYRAKRSGGGTHAMADFRPLPAYASPEET